MAKYQTYNSKEMKKLSKPSAKPSPKPRGKTYDGGGYKTYDSNAMDKLAKERLMEKMDAGSPPPPNEAMKSQKVAKEFGAVERDLPKGGRAMKLAEPLGAAALPEAAAGASRLIGPAAAAVGMLIPSKIGEEEKTIGNGIVPLPQEIKGNPRMQDMEQATKLKPSKQQKFIKRFEEEGKKHFGEDFMYEVEDQTSNPLENYKLKIHSDEPTDELQRLKAVGMHSVMRKNPKMSNPKGGKMNIPKSPNRVVEFNEED